MWSSCWENCKYEFRLYLQNLSGISKNGHNFCIRTRMKKFLYEKSSTQKVTSEFNRGNPVKHFQNPQKPKRIKDTGLLRSGEAKKFKKNSNLLMAHLPMVRHYYLPAFKIQINQKKSY